MPDRILRDELWQSDRFLDLPSDAARLAFLRFLSLADDFGNLEGGQRRLFRVLNACTQIKTEAAATDTIAALMSVDLLRRYEIDGRELFHIPRFRSHRQYLSRLYPMSPWCDATATLGKTRRVINQGLAADVVTTSLPRGKHVAEGVGVGVGVGEKTTRASRTSPSQSGLESVSEQVRQDWIAMRKAKRAAVTPTAIKGIQREADKAGMTLEAALAMCCARGWTGFKAEWTKSAKVGTIGAMSEHGMQTMRNAQALKARLFKEEGSDATE